MRKPPQKHRYSAEKRPIYVTVVKNPEAQASKPGPPGMPGYLSHNAGNFEEAGYSAGQGLFGFIQAPR